MDFTEHIVCRHCGQTRPGSGGACPQCGKPAVAADEMKVLQASTVEVPLRAKTGNGGKTDALLGTPGSKISPAPVAAEARAPSSHAYSLESKEPYTAETVDGLPVGVASKIKAGNARPVQIGGCEVLNEIARGGMGVVYRARQIKLDRVVALKVMIAGEAASEGQVKRFLQEARAAARLKHPNIVPIFEVGEEEGRHFFTMEFIEGLALSTLIARKPLNAAQVVALIEPVAEAVHYAHTQGIIHRDLKPANILIDERNQPRVADFGLARDVSGASSLSQSGNLVGTPAYLSPEQAQGQALDPRSDVYALGVVMYEMLTGKLPFEGPNLPVLLTRIAMDDPPPLEASVPNIDGDLKTIVMTCLEKDRQRRYRSAESLAADLRRFRQGEPIAARPASLGYRIRKQLKKHRGVVAGAAIALLAGLVSVGVWWQIESQRAQAEADRQTADSNRLKAEAQAQTLATQNQQLLQQSEKRWETVFEDEFNAAELGPPWVVLKGRWQISEGTMQGTSRDQVRDPDGILVLETPITGDVVVQVRGTAAGSYSPELALCIFAARESPGYSGYFVSLKPSGIKITRENVGLYANEEIRLKPGKMMQIEFRREAERVTIQIDEYPTIRLTDWTPPTEVDRCHLSVYGWNSEMMLDSVRVQQAALPEKADLLDLAEFQRARGKPALALETLELHLQQAKGKPGAPVVRGLRLKAACLETLKQWQEARAAWEALAAQFPGDENHFRAAAARIRAGESITDTLATLEKTHPQSDCWHELLPAVLGRLYNAQGRFEVEAGQAEVLFKQAQDCAMRVETPARRESAQGLIAMTAEAIVYQSPSGVSMTDKVKFLELAVKLRPDDPTVWNTLAQMYESLKMPDKSVTALERSIQLNPSSATVHYRLARSLRGAGRMDDALKECQWVSENLGDSVQVWELWGNLLVDRGQVAEGLEKYRLALTMDPRYAPAWMNAAVANVKLKQLEEAINCVQTGVNLAPKVPRNQWMAAQVHLAAQDETQALSYLRKAVELEPDNPAFRIDLGTVLLHRSAYEEGLAILRKTPPDPQTQIAHVLMYALVLISTKDYAEAGVQVRRVLMYHPKEAQARAIEALCLAHEGHIERARRQIAEVAEQSRQPMELAYAYLSQAGILELAGEWQEAAACYRRCLKTCNDGWILREVPHHIQRLEKAHGLPPPAPAED